MSTKREIFVYQVGRSVFTRYMHQIVSKIGRVKQKGVFENAQSAQIQTNPAHSHTGIYFTLIYSIVANDFGSGQCPKTRFSHGVAQMSE